MVAFEVTGWWDGQQPLDDHRVVEGDRVVGSVLVMVRGNGHERHGGEGGQKSATAAEQRSRGIVFGSAVELAQTAFWSEFGGWDAEAIVVEGAVAAGKVDGNVDGGGGSVEGIVQQAEKDGGEGGDGRR
jgi:hypothetical protein